jgi:hypothetical protein
MVKNNNTNFFWPSAKKQKLKPTPLPFFGLNLKSQKIKSFSPINLKLYPSRTTREIRLIDRNPFGDRDKDKVPNFFDCKPMNGNLQGWKYKTKEEAMAAIRTKAKARNQSPEAIARRRKKEHDNKHQNIKQKQKQNSKHQNIKQRKKC